MAWFFQGIPFFFALFDPVLTSRGRDAVLSVAMKGASTPSPEILRLAGA